MSDGDSDACLAESACIRLKSAGSCKKESIVERTLFREQG